MIIFTDLRTKRISVLLKELSLDQAISLCKLPPERHELGITAFLRMAAADAKKPREDYVTNPRLWTVSERMRLVCQYLMQVSDDGPDFSIGQSKLSQFIALTSDPEQLQVDLGKVNDIATVYRPLLGVQAEILEQQCTSRGDWLVGCIAAQVRPAEEATPDWEAMSEGEAIAWHKERIAAVRGLAESHFDVLLSAFLTAQDQQIQFFRLGQDSNGLICLPMDETEVGAHPARFRSSTCVSPATRSLFG